MNSDEKKFYLNVKKVDEPSLLFYSWIGSSRLFFLSLSPIICLVSKFFAYKNIKLLSSLSSFRSRSNWTAGAARKSRKNIWTMTMTTTRTATTTTWPISWANCSQSSRWWSIITWKTRSTPKSSGIGAKFSPYPTGTRSFALTSSTRAKLPSLPIWITSSSIIYQPFSTIFRPKSNVARWHSPNQT